MRGVNQNILFKSGKTMFLVVVCGFVVVVIVICLFLLTTNMTKIVVPKSLGKDEGIRD